MAKKEIYILPYTSYHNSNNKNQIIFLIIPKGEG